MARPNQFSFTGLTIEGNLIAPVILKQVATPKANDATDGEYDIPRGVTLRDEMARYYRIGQANLRHLHTSSNPSLAATERFTADLLTQVLGFPAPVPATTEEHDGRLYPVSLQALDGRVPVIVVPPNETLDASSVHLRPDGRRRSAATSLQDWLNVSDRALWGLCTNGKQLRLLRDNPSLTRPAFLEFDLLQIFDNEDYSSFTLLWLLLHRSRFGRPDTPPIDCALERWREDGTETGEQAVKRLAGNVEEALLALASGLLAHPANSELRQRLESGALQLSSSSSQTGSGTGHSFFSQLLRLVYRLIFLLAAEDRDLLHPPDTPTALRELYATGYSVGSLRDRAIRRAAHSGVENTYGDRWQGLVLTFRALAHGEPRLGLPALGGLFQASQTPDLDTLQLSNRALFEAMFKLAWLRDGAAPVRVDWRNMQTEELGSVYEGLLELTPRLADDTRSISFAIGSEQKGNERKTSGSYYTPDSLVQTLLDSALDPVLDRMEAESPAGSGQDPATHLLTITVLDPACGSGHFLLAAARRIATRAARLRAGGVPTLADYRHALRDVVRLCIHGVDRNPMAVELSRVALWIETVEPGKPLGFLDANLRCGDSLLGVFSLEALTHGIPDAAYKPLAGDDKAVAKVFAARNKEDIKGQGRLGLFDGPTTIAVPPALAADALALRSLPEDSEGDITQREQAFERFRANPVLTRYELAADLYTAAFLIPKVKPGAIGLSSRTEAEGSASPTTPQNPEFPGMPLVPVTSHVWRVLENGQILGQLAGAARQAASLARAFHWPLEFPHILLNRDEQLRGFDVVLGNPPWEVMQLSEEEYFTQRAPEVAELSGAKRKRAIAELEQTHPAMFTAYIDDLRVYQSGNEFARASGRFDLSAQGKVNTYALFAELFSSLGSCEGRAGIIVPTGIATDSTNAAFFGDLVSRKRIVSLHDFQTGLGFFDRIGHARYKFCLLTLGSKTAGTDTIAFSFFSRTAEEFADRRRHFNLTPKQISAVSPNSKTAPIFRTQHDADISARIYERVPVLLNERRGIENLWDMEFRQGLFNKTADGAKLAIHEQVPETDRIVRIGKAQGSTSDWLQVLEGHQGYIFDHRFASFQKNEWGEVLTEQKQAPDYEVTSELVMQASDFLDRIRQKGFRLLGYWIALRRVASSTNERTMICAALPDLPATYGWLIAKQPEGSRAALLLANLNSLVCDYCMRVKLNQPSIPLDTLYQIPVVSPTFYAPADLSFIVPRVLELTYTSYSMTPFARDLGYSGEPFAWDEDRRAQLRAELDAWYARAYGLSRDDLRYILDPKDVMGPDYPSETFRVLQKNEIAKFGEYRTQRLVLAAWDRQAAGFPPLSEAQDTPLGLPLVQISTASNYEDLPDGSWTIHRVEPYNPVVPAARLLAAILAEFSRPTAQDEIGLIYHFASKPEKFTPMLQDNERATWLRLVGSDALPTDRRTLQMPMRSDLPFAEALTWLRSRNAILEDLDKRTLQRGSDDPQLPLTGWPEGRARFVRGVLDSVGYDALLSQLAPEDLVWEKQKLG
jgi:hypothetical protein